MYGTIILCDIAITFSRDFGTLLVDRGDGTLAKEPKEVVNYTVVDTVNGASESVNGVDVKAFSYALMFAICGDTVGDEAFGVPGPEKEALSYQLAESVMPMDENLRWIP